MQGSLKFNASEETESQNITFTCDFYYKEDEQLKAKGFKIHLIVQEASKKVKFNSTTKKANATDTNKTADSNKTEDSNKTSDANETESNNNTSSKAVKKPTKEKKKAFKGVVIPTNKTKKVKSKKLKKEKKPLPVKIELKEISRNGVIKINFNQPLKVPEEFSSKRMLNGTFDINKVIEVQIHGKDE